GAMERRELLRRGALLGSLLVGERLADVEPAAAGGLPVAFLEGELEAGDLPAWTLWLSITGKRAQGFAFDPATVDDELQALRFEGRFHDGRLKMTVFGLKDVNFTRPIGTVHGSECRRGLTGALTLKDKSRRKFAAAVIPISMEDSLALAGVYRGTAQDQAG